MRDDDQRAFVAGEKLLEPVNRVEVQVVGRLVEQQRLGMTEERLRQQHADFLAALQFGHRPFVQRVGDIEPLQEHRGIALRRVAVLFADDALELAEAHAVLVRHLGLRVQGVALCERVPQALVAHDHGVDDAILVERVLVLAQHAELPRADHRSPLRLRLAGQQLHERGLARPVRARQAVAPARGKCRRDVLEQDLGAEPHGDAAE